ncbi:hypothetical protein [Lentilactobacillus kribbianus]|uniref:hypothetical protein n=1 Tax=Lentilactobacillus kribbianus TaxID=2729622 RepID=UPI0015539AFE|nr:hypothetical protein [Lentilactobacillus kribbianus]
MSKMIHTKFGYETQEWANADAELEKWLREKKEREENKIKQNRKRSPKNNQ